MDSVSVANSVLLARVKGLNSVLHSQLPCIVPSYHHRCPVVAFRLSRGRRSCSTPRRRLLLAPSVANAHVNNSVPATGSYTVADFMTRKKDLYVLKTTTTVDEALEALVEKRVTGFPVIDDDWKLVGVVSDYDLLALDSISGGTQSDTNLFPDVDSSWKAFNEIQKLLSKTNGKVVGDLMTPAPLTVLETTNLEDAARLLLETKYRRLPVVDNDGKLVGIITRGNIVRAALQTRGQPNS